MLGLIGDVVQGGWDAIDNIGQTIGQGVSTLASGFFPIPQKTRIVSDTIEPANTAGAPYRPVAPEQQSIYETAQWASNEWLGSPYEDNFAIPTKREESQTFSQRISATPEPAGDFLGDIFEAIRSAGEASREVKTIVDEIGSDWGLIPRETITGTPRAGYPEGRDEQHLTDLRTMGANVLEIGRSLFGTLTEQVKGFFNLGYQQESNQPAIAIRHELQPSGKTTTGIIIIGVILLIIYFLGRRK